MKLTKLILESSYKLLLKAVLFVTVEEPVHFLWAVKVLATFNFQIVMTLAIFSRNVAKQHFLESLYMFFKTCEDSFSCYHSVENNSSFKKINKLRFLAPAFEKYTNVKILN